MVQVYDGTEGGGHYTWGFFTVRDPSPLPRTGAAGFTWAGGILIALGLAFVLLSILRATPHPPPGAAADRARTD